jgi:hypothetical protein
MKHIGKEYLGIDKYEGTYGFIYGFKYFLPTLRATNEQHAMINAKTNAPMKECHLPCKGIPLSGKIIDRKPSPSARTLPRNNPIGSKKITNDCIRKATPR